MKNSQSAAFVIGIATLALLGACAAFPPPKSAVDYKKDYDFQQASRVAFAPATKKGSGALLLTDVQAGRWETALPLMANTINAAMPSPGRL